jgi:hypothetical protein
MNVHALLHIAFVIAWALLAFEVIRSLVRLVGLDRRIAVLTAVAVAVAYALGATGPLVLTDTGGATSSPAVVAAPATAPRVVACPRDAVVSTHAATGHIDTATVGDEPAVTSPATADVPAGVDLHLTGWASLASGPGMALCVIEDGRAVTGIATYGVFRPDVATATNVSANSGAGFAIAIKPPAGRHVLMIGVVELDGRTVDRVPGELDVAVH